MKLILTIIIGLVFCSCKNDDSKYYTHGEKKAKKKEQAYPDSLKLFQNFYAGMTIKEVDDLSTSYNFSLTHRNMVYDIVPIYSSESRLESLLLKMEDNTIQLQDFDALMKLYESKYGNFEMNTTLHDEEYKLNYRIKNIYWRNEQPSLYIESQVTNLYFSYDACNPLYHSNGHSSKCSSSKYFQRGTLRAKNKLTGKSYNFDIDVEKAKVVHAKYRKTTAYKLTKEGKVIKIIYYYLLHPEKFKRFIGPLEELSWKEKELDQLEDLRNISNNYITIEYSIQKDTSKADKIYEIDSTTYRKNTADI